MFSKLRYRRKAALLEVLRPFAHRLAHFALLDPMDKSKVFSSSDEQLKTMRQLISGVLRLREQVSADARLYGRSQGLLSELLPQASELTSSDRLEQAQKTVVEHVVQRLLSQLSQVYVESFARSQKQSSGKGGGADEKRADGGGIDLVEIEKMPSAAHPSRAVQAASSAVTASSTRA